MRPARFVTQKVVSAAKRIAAGSKERLRLGRLDIARDWGWAPEYVEAMWLMLQQAKPADYIIATGETNSLQDFVDASFGVCGLDWKEHVDQGEEWFRPTDITISYADPSLAERELGWIARFKMKDVVRKMLTDTHLL